MALKRASQLYIVTVIVLGFIVLAAFTVTYPIHDYFSTIFFTLLAIVAESQTVFIGNGKSISVSSAIFIAAMLTAGPSAGIWAATICICGSVTRMDNKIFHVFNTKPSITFFNVGNYVLTYAIISQITFRFRQTVISHAYPSLEAYFRDINAIALSLLIAITAGVLFNSILIALHISLRNGISFLRTILYNLIWPTASVIVICMLGVFLTALYVVYGWFLVVLFFAPFMLARWAFKTYKDLQQSYLQTVESLAFAIEAKDEYTSGHSKRVEMYSALIAHEMKLSNKRCQILRYAALLHDVGKIGIPENILNKPGKLTDEEWVYIRSHPEKGAHIIEDIEFLKDAVPIVRSHHEWYNGGGYPQGKSAKDLPLEAMILCAADSYDAMTSDRPYRRRLENEVAMRELHEKAGIQFAPEVVEALERALIKEGELTAASVRKPAAGKDSHVF